MSKVCHHALCYELVSPGDIIFDAGEIPQDPAFYIAPRAAVCDRRAVGVES